MKIVMLGAPGAGKGTAAAELSQKYGIPHISTGDIFRKNIREETALGIEAKKFMDEGGLVPDELTIKMILERLNDDDCKDGFILDGFPRTISQAESLREALSLKKTKIDYVININASDEVIIERLSGRLSCPKCGAVYHLTGKPPLVSGKCDRCGATLIQRDDDKPETIKKRLKSYHEKTAPLVEYYEKDGILLNFDGNKKANEVLWDMVKVLF